MRYSFVSAYTAGVLSIFLIFTLFSSFGSGFGFDFADTVVKYEENKENPCAMNASPGSVPFGNTTIMSGYSADACEENRLLNMPVPAEAKSSIVSGDFLPLHSSPLSDRRPVLSVRLLI